MRATPKEFALASKIVIEAGQITPKAHQNALKVAIATIREVSELAAKLCDAEDAEFSAAGIRRGEHLP